MDNSEGTRIRNRTNDPKYPEYIVKDGEVVRTLLEAHKVVTEGNKEKHHRIRSGKKYYIVGRKPFKAVSKRIDDESEEIHDEIIEYRYYNIEDSSRKSIGTVTRFTPLERTYALINRYDYPDHMDESDFIAYVHYTGKLSPDTIDTRMPYVTIPPAVAEYNDILVDDAVLVKVTRKDGKTYEMPRHVSRMKDNLIVSLSAFKFLYVEGSEVKEYHPIDNAQWKNSEWYRLDHFLMDGVPVRILLTPLPNHQYYNLSEKAVEIMRSRAVKE